MAKSGASKKEEGAYVPRLHTVYEKEIRAAMQKQFNYTNPMQIPKLEKIVINMGVGENVNDSKIIQAAANELGLITGQKAKICLAKKAIASFKLRENLAIGCKVTLRKQRMYEFLDRLITIAIPRIRDFRGLNGKAFDGRGNYSMGVKEQIIFPEIDYDKVDAVRGLDITITTSAKSDQEARALLEQFKFPFRT